MDCLLKFQRDGFLHRNVLTKFRLDSQTSFTEIRAGMKSNFPASILETSRISLIRPSKCCPLELMRLTYCSCFSLSGPRLFSSRDSENPKTLLSGVRNSWLMVAKNSSLVRLAYSNSVFKRVNSDVRSSTRRSSSSAYWLMICSARLRPLGRGEPFRCGVDRGVRRVRGGVGRGPGAASGLGQRDRRTHRAARGDGRTG